MVKFDKVLFGDDMGNRKLVLEAVEKINRRMIQNSNFERSSKEGSSSILASDGL